MTDLSAVCLLCVYEIGQRLIGGVPGAASRVRAQRIVFLGSGFSICRGVCGGSACVCFLLLRLTFAENDIGHCMFDWKQYTAAGAKEVRAYNGNVRNISDENPQEWPHSPWELFEVSWEGTEIGRAHV